MSGDENAYDLEWEFYECLLQSLLEMASFVIVLALMSLQISATFSVNKTLQTFCIGSYGNVFAVLSVIWHLHLLWSYRILTELFIFISHVQAQRAMYNITLTRSVLVVLMATVISRCVGLLMDLFCFI
nr:Bm5235, isoform c [Brugia malayi]